MATHDIFMPALSSTMTEGKIVQWLKEPGEKVERGESVLVVESDKADMDVESFHDGFLASILMPTGSTAPVGETIGLIVETEEELSEVKAKSPSPESTNELLETPSKESSAETVTAIPKVQESVPSPITKENNLNKVSIPKETKKLNDGGRIIASPKAKKLATQLGVDLSGVLGTGPHGRIQAEDVKKAKGQPVNVPWVAESNAPASIAPSAIPIAESSPKQSKSTEILQGQCFGEPGKTAAFNTLQQAVNRNMEASLAVPCFRVGYTITTDKFDNFYKQMKPHGITMTALLAKAVGVTLARHPQVNASYSPDGMSYPSQINVAVAVAMEDGGLITPVLKNVDTKDLFELSREWADLVKRSRSKQLQPDEYNSGTFTLSNLGMFGVDRFDAILPPGTGSILAVASSQPNVIADKNGSISIKRQMQVNLTADHRVIYGADGALFLKDLANLIESDPTKLQE